MTLEEVLRSPQFKQALFDVQTAACERLWAEMQQDEVPLTPGNNGQNCRGNSKYCDECDYLICCTNYNGLCDKCLKENGTCQLAKSDPPTGESL